jgi:hypothetical protein
MRLTRLLPCLALSSVLAAPDQTQQAPAPYISQAAVQNAFQILRSEYIRSKELNFEELNRAALTGLLQRLDLGASLVHKQDSQAPVVARGVLSEKLPGGIGYLRPQSFAAEEASSFQTKVRELADAGLRSLILDLRSPAMPGDFETAAAMLEPFMPNGELLFKLKQVGRDDAQLFISHSQAAWKHPILVLVDADTSNLGETVAAVLQKRRQALVIGSKTRGATVLYETRPLDNFWEIRYARAEMLLDDETSLFGQGIKPDFPIDLPLESKRRLFPQENRPPLLQTLIEQPRPRYNEAALVARKNPELEEYIRRSSANHAAGASKMPDPPRVHDTVLQRAVDLFITRDHFENSQLRWDTPGAEPAPTIRKAAREP